MTSFFAKVIAKLASLFATVFSAKQWGKYSERSDNLEEQLEDAERDAKIKSRPVLTGDDFRKRLNKLMRKKRKES